jgi:hypothetical protein
MIYKMKERLDKRRKKNRSKGLRRESYQGMKKMCRLDVK